MKKCGLKIFEYHYINMENLCSFYIEEDNLYLHLTNQGSIHLVMDEAKRKHANKYQTVSVNEFKRIKREVLEYMGVK